MYKLSPQVDLHAVKLVCFVFLLYMLLMISILISDMIHMHLISKQIDFFKTFVNPSLFLRHLILKQLCGRLLILKDLPVTTRF